MAELNYKTFTQLMNSCREDLFSFDDGKVIMDHRYIKTARTCNATLGLKLNKQYETRIEVNGQRVDLPDNLLSIMAIVAYPQQGSWCIPTPTKRSLNYFCSNTLNKFKPHPGYRVDVDSQQLLFDFPLSHIDIGYISHMEDEEGNLLILDHELTNDYYEWAIKEKIFTDLWHNNDADVFQKLQDARNQLSIHKGRAKMIVSTPEYSTLKKAARQTELDFYNKYVRQFM